MLFIKIHQVAVNWLYDLFGRKDFRQTNDKIESNKFFKYLGRKMCTNKKRYWTITRSIGQWKKKNLYRNRISSSTKDTLLLVLFSWVFFFHVMFILLVFGSAICFLISAFATSSGKR